MRKILNSYHKPSTGCKHHDANVHMSTYKLINLINKERK